MTRVPDFLIIGAMKSGTTTLYDDLARHPGLFLPDDKEPDILHHAAGDASRARSLYQNHFRGAADTQLCGEASTMYTMTPWFGDVSTLAREVAGPHLKLIYIVRDPIDRISSHLMHDYMAGRISDTDFDKVVRSHERFISISDYARQIEPWIHAFGRDAILVLTLDELSRDRAGVIERVVRFIGAEPGLVEVGAGASNPRAAIRATSSPIVRSVITSPFYRRQLRRLIPRKLLAGLRLRLTTSKDIPPAALSSEMISELAEELRPSMERFRTLTGADLASPVLQDSTP
ncbi:sulfotransferase family protein [Hyphomonas polymorpha PS728]|uniref:Sulfotransferase family protein n=1 Tax=Hyphomonas polymorpha PS728 TaxID=1280954 RepID=A0A062VDY2_9PROT|nr:sulfotransferase domain-containing protein [Hyphomonas polymorpha]KCZ96672.1 sulfotransferase family protein [Hyphomonas polymorpha PS728]